MDPSGVAILGVYKWGSVRMGLESPRYAVPNLMWLGACHDMLEGADEEVWQPLTDRDRAMIGNLRNGVLQHNDAWTQEVDLMESRMSFLLASLWLMAQSFEGCRAYAYICLSKTLQQQK